MGPISLVAAAVVLLSIDGLKPDYVLEADGHGLKIENLRRLVEDGVYATAVTGVYPTVTYPSHATMLTGVAPDRHGIHANHPFDPLGLNRGGWYWYAEDLRAVTLWQAAGAAGLLTASVDWPVSVGAPISHNIVQYWRAGNAEDRKVIRALSTPGLLREAEGVLGPYPEGNDYGLAADRTRARFVEFLLERKRPRLLTAYFSGLDSESHDSGPGSVQTFEVLEALDELVGRLRRHPEVAILCVVSDHGFLPSDKELHLNAALRRAGLIEVDDSGTVTDFTAFAWTEGGSAMVVVRDPTDEGARAKIRELLSGLSMDPGNGIESLLEGEEARMLRGSPDASFVVGLAPGFRTGSSLDLPIVRESTLGGTHGYLPGVAAMDSSFFLVGEGVPRGVKLGRIDMRDVAPTLASLLGIALPAAEGRDLLSNHAADHPPVHRR